MYLRKKFSLQSFLYLIDIKSYNVKSRNFIFFDRLSVCFSNSFIFFWAKKFGSNDIMLPKLIYPSKFLPKSRHFKLIWVLILISEIWPIPIMCVGTLVWRVFKKLNQEFRVFWPKWKVSWCFMQYSLPVDMF